MIYKNARLIGKYLIQGNVLIGVPSKSYLDKSEEEWPKTEIKSNATIRSGTVIYCDVLIGENFTSGHNVLIREGTIIGDNVLVGTNTVIDGNTRIGNNVSIQSAVYIPTNTVIEDRVFIGPNAVFTNDKYPIRKNKPLKGPILRRGATIGANCTILAGIEIGEGAIVAAGAVVAKDVPPWKLAIGVPAVIKELPEYLKILNKI